MNNIKRGTSISGGMVLTDMPIEALVALRDAVDDAIRNSSKDNSDRLLTDIISAMDAANVEGYKVSLNSKPINPSHLFVEPDENEDYWDEYEDDDDYWDDDNEDDDDENDDLCYSCRDDCLYCSYF